MLHIAGQIGKDVLDPTNIVQFTIDAAWAISSTHHTVLYSSSVAAVFWCNMLFNLQYMVDW